MLYIPNCCFLLFCIVGNKEASLRTVSIICFLGKWGYWNVYKAFANLVHHDYFCFSSVSVFILKFSTLLAFNLLLNFHYFRGVTRSAIVTINKYDSPSMQFIYVPRCMCIPEGRHSPKTLSVTNKETAVEESHKLSQIPDQNE